MRPLSPAHEHAETRRRQLVAGIVMREGKILLVHNIKHGLRIEPTGGKIHDGETPEQAAKREAEEELSIIIEAVEELAAVAIETPEGPFENHLLLCKLVSGEPAIPEAESTKLGGFAWYTPDEADALEQLVPELKAALPLIRAKIAAMDKE